MVLPRSRILRTKDNWKVASLWIYLRYCHLRGRIGKDCLVAFEGNEECPEIERNCTILSLTKPFWYGATDILLCAKNGPLDEPDDDNALMTSKELVDTSLQLNWLFTSYPHLCHALVTYELHQSALNRFLVYCHTVSSIRPNFSFFFQFFFCFVIGRLSRLRLANKQLEMDQKMHSFQTQFL